MRLTGLTSVSDGVPLQAITLGNQLTPIFSRRGQ